MLATSVFEFYQSNTVQLYQPAHAHKMVTTTVGVLQIDNCFCNM